MAHTPHSRSDGLEVFRQAIRMFGSPIYYADSNYPMDNAFATWKDAPNNYIRGMQNYLDGKTNEIPTHRDINSTMYSGRHFFIMMGLLLNGNYGYATWLRRDGGNKRSQMLTAFTKDLHLPNLSFEFGDLDSNKRNQILIAMAVDLQLPSLLLLMDEQGFNSLKGNKTLLYYLVAIDPRCAAFMPPDLLTVEEIKSAILHQPLSGKAEDQFSQKLRELVEHRRHTSGYQYYNRGLYYGLHPAWEKAKEFHFIGLLEQFRPAARPVILLCLLPVMLPQLIIYTLWILKNIVAQTIYSLSAILYPLGREAVMPADELVQKYLYGEPKRLSAIQQAAEAIIEEENAKPEKATWTIARAQAVVEQCEALANSQSVANTKPVMAIPVGQNKAKQCDNKLDPQLKTSVPAAVVKPMPSTEDGSELPRARPVNDTVSSASGVPEAAVAMVTILKPNPVPASQTDDEQRNPSTESSDRATSGGQTARPRWRGSYSEATAQNGMFGPGVVPIRAGNTSCGPTP